MSIENYIRAMPKVDLHVQLEGAMPKDLLLLIAEQTDTASTYKRSKQYQEWVGLLKNPDFERLDEIIQETAAWVRHPDDLARVVYDLGVQFSKQHIQYAEIAVIPSVFTDAGLGIMEFLDAINDGADRVERAWQVRMNWIMAMPRERPRKSDDIARWAISVTGQKGNVVGLSLVGKEGPGTQPLGQFKRAFATAEKKELARITHAYSAPECDPLEAVIEAVNPTRITDSWGLVRDEEALTYVVDNAIPVMLTPSREVRLGRMESVADYPLRELVSKGVNVILSSGMPAMFETSLNDEYIAAVEQADLTLDELEMIALNGVRATLLPDDEKQALLVEFEQAYAALRVEHLAEEIE